MPSCIHRGNPSILIAIFSLSLSSLLAAQATLQWKSIAPGMDYKYVTAKTRSAVGDSRIFILRVDPNLWQLEAIGISQTGESTGHTARDWSQRQKFSAAINAGMFATDFKTHLGYMGSASHVNSGRANSYQSVAAFDPRNSRSPPFRIFDLDAPGARFEDIQKDYASALQNLRLIKKPGSNQWSQQSRQWSEAALGEDDAGRILFIYSRSPFSMHDLNNELLAAGIGIVAAQHLEGGPEAQLYLHVGSFEMEMYGSYETSFRKNDSNSSAAWPVPNILGLRPRATGSH
ncbi:MAG TPA: phosphodiester glycosidase family protein [Candidatus Angelobacter sp.]|nr:phosphodiester glycosidase family protein [Candidatus Angelobacter sp.]